MNAYIAVKNVDMSFQHNVRGVIVKPFGLWPNMSPASTYAKSIIKLPLDEADAGSLKLTN